VQHWLFPGSAPQIILAGYTNVAVVLLLLVAGLEVNLGIVRRCGRAYSRPTSACSSWPPR
jgi:hypothetical protein